MDNENDISIADKLKMNRNPLTVKTPVKPTTHHSTHKKINCEMNAYSLKVHCLFANTPNRVSHSIKKLTTPLKNKCGLDLKMVESYHVNSLRNLLSTRSAEGTRMSPAHKRATSTLLVIKGKFKLQDDIFEQKQMAFLKLYQVSSTVISSSGENPFDLEINIKFQQYIIRELQQTMIKKEDISTFSRNIETEDIKAHGIVPRFYHPILKNKSQAMYKRMLASIGVLNDMLCFENYIKLCHYYIDCNALSDEWIPIIAKMICLEGEKRMVDELILFLKDEMDARFKDKVGPLLKALTANYMTLGIIDGNGLFDSKRFKESYNSGVLSIDDLLCMLNLK